VNCGTGYCWAESSNNWLATSSDSFNAVFLSNEPAFARRGDTSGLLGSAYGVYGDFPGTIAPTQPLQTTAGKMYLIEVWQWSGYNPPFYQQDAWFDIIWNGVVVSAVRPGYRATYTRFTVEVTAVGDDTIAFHGGRYPDYSFLDDIAVWLI